MAKCNKRGGVALLHLMEHFVEMELLSVEGLLGSVNDELSEDPVVDKANPQLSLRPPRP